MKGALFIATGLDESSESLEAILKLSAPGGEEAVQGWSPQATGIFEEGHLHGTATQCKAGLGALDTGKERAKSLKGHGRLDGLRTVSLP